MDETQIDNFRQQLLQLRLELMNISSTSDDAAKTVELDHEENVQQHEPAQVDIAQKAYLF